MTENSKMAEKPTRTPKLPYIKQYNRKTRILVNPITKQKPYLHPGDNLDRWPTGSKFFKTHYKYLNRGMNPLEFCMSTGRLLSK